MVLSEFLSERLTPAVAITARLQLTCEDLVRDHATQFVLLPCPTPKLVQWPSPFTSNSEADEATSVSPPRSPAFSSKNSARGSSSPMPRTRVAREPLRSQPMGSSSTRSSRWVTASARCASRHISNRCCASPVRHAKKWLTILTRSYCLCALLLCRLTRSSTTLLQTSQPAFRKKDAEKAPCD